MKITQIDSTDFFEAYGSYGKKSPADIERIKKALARPHNQAGGETRRKENPSQKAANLKRDYEFAKSLENQKEFNEENTTPTPDEAGERVRQFLQQHKAANKGKPGFGGKGVSPEEHERNQAQRGHDRAEQQQRDDRATAFEESLLNEISTELLGKYKAAAGQQASDANKKGDTKTANKRFSGIVKATKKQFANDAKTVSEGGMGWISRSAPAQDVSYEKTLGPTTDTWKGNKVAVNEISRGAEQQWVAGANKWRSDQTTKSGHTDQKIVDKSDRRAERTMKIKNKHIQNEQINEISVNSLKNYSDTVKGIDPATTPKYKMVKHAEGHAKANRKIAQKTGDRSNKMYESMLADIMHKFSE